MDKPSYIGAALTSTPNLVGAGLAMAAGGLLAVTSGLILGAIPLILLASAEAIVAMVVPSIPSFRAKVDRDWRVEKRGKARIKAIQEIGRRANIYLSDNGYTILGAKNCSPENQRILKAYNDMVDRTRALASVAEDRGTRLGPAEIERMHVASLDYLSMWLAKLIIQQRASSVNIGDLQAKINQLNGDIEQAKNQRDAIRMRTLEGARNEYLNLTRSHQNLGPRLEALEAAMIAMPDKINEIQQMVMAAPYSSSVDNRLEDSLSRLRLAEEVEQQIHSELYVEIPQGDLMDIFNEPRTQRTPSNTEQVKKVQQKARQTT